MPHVLLHYMALMSKLVVATKLHTAVIWKNPKTKHVFVNFLYPIAIGNKAYVYKKKIQQLLL